MSAAQAGPESPTLKASPVRGRHSPAFPGSEIRKNVSASVKAGLSVTARPGKSGGRQKSIPCERCNVETCGSLQLPCGRLVILCEKCALNFYDVLIAKISKFEGPFEEFLLDQQGRGNSTKQEKGQASPRSPRKAADQQRAVLPKPADQQRHSTRLDRGAGDAVDGGAAKNRQAGDTVEPGAFLAAKGGHDTLARSHDIRGSRAGLGAGRRRTDRFVMASSGSHPSPPSSPGTPRAHARLSSATERMLSPSETSRLDQMQAREEIQHVNDFVGAGRGQARSVVPYASNHRQQVTYASSHRQHGPADGQSSITQIGMCHSPVPGGSKRVPTRGASGLRAHASVSPLRSAGGGSLANLGTTVDSLIHGASKNGVFGAENSAVDKRLSSSQNSPTVEKRLPANGQSSLRRGNSFGKTSQPWGTVPGMSAEKRGPAYSSPARITSASRTQRTRQSTDYLDSDIRPATGLGSLGAGADRFVERVVAGGMGPGMHRATSPNPKNRGPGLATAGGSFHGRKI